MKINFKEIKPIIKIVNDSKYPSLFAYVSLKLVDEHERALTVNGFTIRKSKFDGKPYLTPPTKRTGMSFFKFVLIDNSLWKEIEKEVLSKYEYNNIPVIEEDS